MKINRKQLRHMILKEFKEINENKMGNKLTPETLKQIGRQDILQIPIAGDSSTKELAESVKERLEKIYDILEMMLKQK